MGNRFRITSIVILFGFQSFGHETHHSHHNAQKEKRSSDAYLLEINKRYLVSVKSIFQSKCMDCHSDKTNYPWYSGIPGVKTLIESDIAEAKKHLNMTGDFPFKGHGTIREDLDAIQKAIDEDSMPPLRYRSMHWNSKLTSEEKVTVSDWIKESLKKVPSP